jgi:hypothetical protein
MFFIRAPWIQFPSDGAIFEIRKITEPGGELEASHHSSVRVEKGGAKFRGKTAIAPDAPI